MTWTAFRRRAEVLRDVAAAAEERRDGILPVDVEGVAERFDGDLDLIGALTLTWHTRLSGALERHLAQEPRDLAAATVRAWCETAEAQPGLRLVLDRATEQPRDAATGAAMLRATRKERVRLALAAGLASSDGPAAEAAGEALEARARSGLALLAPDPTPDPAPAVTVRRRQERFVARLRAALAA